MTYSPDGTRLAVASGIGIWLYDAHTGDEVSLLTGHTDRVTSVSFSPDGTTLASGSSDGTVRLWEVASRQEKATLEGHTSWVYSVSFSPDGTALASGNGDGTILLWDMAPYITHTRLNLPAGALARLSKGHLGSGDRAVTYSPDGTRLAAADETGVWLYDAHTGDKVTLLTGHTDGVYSVSFSPDGTTLASGSDDGTIRLWEVESGQEKATLRGSDRVYSVSFSPDGTTLASGSADRTVRLWEVANHQGKATLRGHTAGVYSASFSPDGTTIASGSADSTVRLWEVASRQEKATLRGHTAGVYSVSFSPDGTTIASGSADSTILLWDMAPYIIPSAPKAIYASPLPAQAALLANYPNPFNPETWIPFQLHTLASVRLSIYDVRGALVREIDLGQRAAGRYLTRAGAVHWDGRDQMGQRVASGMYLYRLQAGPIAQVRKMLLVK